MNYISLIFATLVIGLLAKCGSSSPPLAQPRLANPCEQIGVSYSPVGRIVQMKELMFKNQRDYGTHALIDASGNLQWVLKSTNMNLESYADGKMWYRVYGTRSENHPDLLVVCAVGLER